MKSNRYRTFVFFTSLLTLLNPYYAFALDIPLMVKETQGVARSSEMVHNGVPIARGDNVTATANLLISDGSSSVPSTFTVLSRWGGGKDDVTKSIKWILVSFPASVSANATNTYYLRDYGTPATITNTVSVTDGASSITVDTGSAEFVISETTGTLFDSIAIGGASLATGNSSHNSTIDGQAEATANAPTVNIERQNAQYVCIKSVGTYANTPVGGANAEPIHYRIRYEFYAGSPTAIVTHKFFWAGEHDIVPDIQTIRVNNVNLRLPDMSGFSSSAVYATQSVSYSGITGEAVFVSQDRRALFSDPHQATVSHGATSQTTVFAETPAVVSTATNGSLVATIGNMQRYEPQSIEADTSGKITINDMAEYHNISDALGTWAKIGIGALSSASFTNINSQVIAPTEHRLMALPSTDYLLTTNVFEKLPNPQSTTPEVQAWWTELGEVIDRTEEYLDEEKAQGLLTWGTLPRTYNEFGVNNDWDRIYEGGFITDYHNAWKNMTFYALLTQDPDKLSEYAFPGALRMLHTQIIQVDNYSNPYSTRMGWGYAGYMRYRENGNSMHSYFDNLFAYYYLTGDMEVLDLLDVGAKTTREWYTRSGGVLIPETEQAVDWEDYAGRNFYQMASIYRFLGQAYNDEYLDDWSAMYDHFASTYLLLLSSGGTEYGFSRADYRDTDNVVLTGQSWMDALYTCRGLYELYLEYGDMQLGDEDITISRILRGFGYGFWDYNRLTHDGADGTWSGEWANVQSVSYTGADIGGTITDVVHMVVTDHHLYDDGKINVATEMIRGGALSGDAALLQHGLDGLSYMTSNLSFPTIGRFPLSKVAGLMFSNMADAMTYYDGAQSAVNLLLPPSNLLLD